MNREQLKQINVLLDDSDDLRKVLKAVEGANEAHLLIDGHSIPLSVDEVLKFLRLRLATMESKLGELGFYEPKVEPLETRGGTRS